jgi:anti-anti-sigma factor
MGNMMVTSIRNGGRARILTKYDLISEANLAEFRNEFNALVNAGIVDVTVDFESIELVDSPAIGMLISVQNALRKQGGTLKLENVSGNIVQMLQIMRLDRRFLITGRNDA